MLIQEGGEIQQELIRFLTCPQRWRDAPGTELRPEGDRRTSKYTRCAWRRSRGGPIAEETTGDRKEKKNRRSQGGSTPKAT